MKPFGSSLSSKYSLMHQTAVSDWQTTCGHQSLQSITWSTSNTTTATTTPITYTLSPLPTYDPDQIGPPPARLPPPRAFNRYINASDLLEEFIRWLGTQRVRQRQVLELPLDLFVKWLVIRACEEDQEEPNVTLELPAPPPRLRCVQCQRYMPKSKVPFDRAVCAVRYFEKAA